MTRPKTSQPPFSFVAPRLDRVEAAGGTDICLFLFEEKQPLQGLAGLVDWRLLGRISNAIIDREFAGRPGECRLFPTEGRLPQKQVMAMGLGPRTSFGADAFRAAVDAMWTHSVGDGPIIASLPGRGEGVCDSADAMEWLLALHDERPDHPPLIVAETGGAQQVMLPILEKWRLKQVLQPA